MKLGLSERPAPTFGGLQALYAAWCRKVPFDNIRKLIHLRRQDSRPLPGNDAGDFFEAWLLHGTGGTCWAGNGALHALLGSLGFAPMRGIATMLVAPNLPPNHGTVLVECDGGRFMVDASILHGEPLLLDQYNPAPITHAPWGAQSSLHDGQWTIHWRPLHKPDGLDCRIDRVDVPAQSFHEQHERTRHWSPFNYELYGRLNRESRVIGAAFGQRVEFDATGNVLQHALNAAERLRFLIEDLGIHEELANLLPPDAPTPAPPDSGKAGTHGGIG
jgi:arylamine N-acetyltransferase